MKPFPKHLVPLAAVAAIWSCGPEGPAPAPETASSASAIVSREDNVVVVNEPGLVTIIDAGGTQIIGTNNSQRERMIELVADEIGDSFDAYVVFTTFGDRSFPNIGANGVASNVEYTGIRNDVEGIGRDLFDERDTYGLAPNARVSGFVFGNELSILADGFGVSVNQLNQPLGPLHALIARRLSDRWLFNASYLDGMMPFDLTGSDGWSNVADSDGSLQGGVDLIDNGDGTFTVGDFDQGFHPLDLYLMGFIGPETVPDFVVLRQPTVNGMPVGADTPFNVGTTIEADSAFVTIQDVQEAMGQRNPPAIDAVPYQRIAFVLLTLPGEARQSYEEDLAVLNGLAEDFPASWQAWSGVTICTQLGTRCPEPLLRVDEVTIDGSGDGLVAPGDEVELNLTVRNVGLGDASGARIRFEPIAEGITVQPSSVDLPDIPQGEERSLTAPVTLRVLDGTACGEALDIRAIIELAEGPILGNLVPIPVGTELLREDSLEEAPNWTVDPDRTDSAVRGQWALGIPESVLSPGVGLTQPAGDNTITDDSFAFMTQPRAGNIFSSGDVDGGRTTLESPVFAVGDALDPLLRVFVWRNVFDFSNPTGPVPGDVPLFIEASNDGGATFTTVLEYTETTTTTWERVEVRLSDFDIEPTNRMVFRFSIEDPDNFNVEAGIDDLQLIDFLPGCPGVEPAPDPGTDTGNPMPGDGEDSNGGGCAVTGFAEPWLLFAGASLFARRRRRR